MNSFYELSCKIDQKKLIQAALTEYSKENYGQCIVEWLRILYGISLTKEEAKKQAKDLLYEDLNVRVINEERICSGLQYYYDTYFL